MLFFGCLYGTVKAPTLLTILHRKLTSGLILRKRYNCTDRPGFQALPAGWPGKGMRITLHAIKTTWPRQLWSCRCFLYKFCNLACIIKVNVNFFVGNGRLLRCIMTELIPVTLQVSYITTQNCPAFATCMTCEKETILCMYSLAPLRRKCTEQSTHCLQKNLRELPVPLSAGHCRAI